MNQSTLIRNNNAFLELEGTQPAKTPNGKKTIPKTFKVLMVALMVTSAIYLSIPTPLHSLLSSHKAAAGGAKKDIVKATVYISFLEECKAGDAGCSKKNYKIKTMIPNNSEIKFYAKEDDAKAFGEAKVTGTKVSVKPFVFKGNDFKNNFDKFANGDEKEKKVKLCFKLGSLKEDCQNLTLKAGAVKRAGTQIKVRIAYIKKIDGKFVAEQVQKNIYFK